MTAQITAPASPKLTPDFSNVAKSRMAQAPAGEIAIDHPEPRGVADEIAAHVGALPPLDAAALMETLRRGLTFAAAESAMAVASRLVLDGFTLRTDVKIVKYPDRYVDKRGVMMWSRIMKLLSELEAEAQEAPTDTPAESAA